MSNFSSFVPSAGGGADLQEFTTSGTWTKPAGATFVMVEAWGGGGGGGSGRRSVVSSVRVGGGGGGGGAYAYRLLKVSELALTESVTIGAGGSGAAAVSSNDTSGVAGGAGGSTSFGTHLTTFGGSGGNPGGSALVQISRGGGVLNTGGVPFVTSSSGLDQQGHFGAGISGLTTVTVGIPSGFGGGSGGGAPTSGAAGNGGSSYQGGAGGGGGGLLDISNNISNSGAGGGTTGTSGTGALEVVYPGASGNTGGTREGASGGAAGAASIIIVSNQTMAYGSSTFAVADTQGLIATSSTGTGSWTFAATPLNTSTPWLLHDGSNFVLFNSTATRCWTTADFVTYTEKTGLSSGITVQRVRYANGNYFVMGNNAQLWNSTDLVTWTQVSSGNGGIIYDICWTGSNYVAVSASSPRVRYSSNLASWSTPATGGTNDTYSCESNGSGTVVIQTNSTPFAQQSTDHGVNFTNVSTTLASAGTIRSLAYLNSTWLAAASNSLWTSTDGDTWTNRVSASGDNLGGGFAYDGTTFAVGSTTSNSTVARTAVPASLGTWTDRTVTAINVAGGTGGTGGVRGGGGGGGGASVNGNASGAGGSGGNGFVRVYTW